MWIHEAGAACDTQSVSTDRTYGIALFVAPCLSDPRSEGLLLGGRWRGMEALLGAVYG
jgi:hypothetical protein